VSAGEVRGTGTETPDVQTTEPASPSASDPDEPDEPKPSTTSEPEGADNEPSPDNDESEAE
jgi:hypothetical protein